MGEELKACPFCGSKAEMVTNRSGDNFVRCTNRQCAAKTRLYHENEAGARLAWNRRSERTCRNLNPPSCRDFECSECGESSEFTPGFMPNYCPNCGARVIEEGV